MSGDTGFLFFGAIPFICGLWDAFFSKRSGDWVIDRVTPLICVTTGLVLFGLFMAGV